MRFALIISCFKNGDAIPERDVVYMTQGAYIKAEFKVMKMGKTVPGISE
jgi:hypothetical protein